MAVVPSIADVKNIVLKTLNWIKLGMVPVGTIQTGLYTAPPAGYLAFKRTDQILKSQYPALCELLFKINNFKGDGSTYANIPNVDHRVIELASNVSEVGQLMEAGLPDIVGHASFTYQIIGFGGAIYPAVNDMCNAAGDKIIGPFNRNIGFQASRHSALYGKSNTNQNSALRLLAIIKI